MSSGFGEVIRKSEVVTRGEPWVIRDNVVWLWEIRDPHLINVLRNALAYMVHQVENYSQYVVRKMASLGLYTDFYSNILVEQDGVTLTLTFRLKGVYKEILEENIRKVRAMAMDRSPSSIKYKAAEWEIGRLEVLWREFEGAGHSDSAAYSEEGFGEGGEAEGEAGGSDSEGGG